MRQPRGALAVFPNPVAKAILQLLLFLSGGDSLRLIHGAGSVFVVVVGSRCAPVQRLLDQFGRAESGGAVGRPVVYDVPCAIVQFDGPCRDDPGVPDLHACSGNIQQFGNEIADVRRRNPRRAEARFDLARFQVFGLHRPQRFDVSAIGRIERFRSLGSGEFRAHVAAEIAVGGLPDSTLWIAVDERSKFVLKFGSTPPGERLHARPTDFAGLVEGHQQCLGRGLDSLHRAITLQRAAVEYGGLGRPACLRIEFFERQQKRLIRIASERLLTFSRALRGPKREVKESYVRFRRRRASTMASSGASESWVRNTSRTASRTCSIPRIRARAVAGSVSGSNASPRRLTIWPSRSARPPSLTAPAAGTCSEIARNAGPWLSRLLYTAAGRSETAFPRSPGSKVPIRAGTGPYCRDSIPMRPSIISGWRAKYSLISSGPSAVATGLSSIQLSPGGVSADRFWRNRMSVVTSVPAFAWNAVFGSRTAPSRVALSARCRRTVESSLSML